MNDRFQLLREYLKSQGYTQDSIAKSLGVDKAHVNKLLNGKKGFGKQTAKKWSDLFGLSYTWLITGEGEMVASCTPQPLDEVDTASLPLIPIKAMAGALNGADLSIMEYECEKYIVPVFKGAEFLIMIQGDSMMPKYMPGDIVACKRVPMDRLWFQWGKTYVIDTTQGALIKRIEPSDQDGNISIHSDNTKYKPFNLPVEEVNGVALVVGTIRVE